MIRNRTSYRWVGDGIAARKIGSQTTVSDISRSAKLTDFFDETMMLFQRRVSIIGVVPRPVATIQNANRRTSAIERLLMRRSASNRSLRRRRSAMIRQRSELFFTLPIEQDWSDPVAR
jgi:hypothetical protein